ncbi:alpha/beta fold hydrolase [Rhodobacter sp. NTK016B]|uniref:alpha/beta hydrolase family protein n=1 Tax=Rhodobacter sp. NTK016B TaxID=2759676 RepID=UPI001A8F758B|nr:alpha/beta fold hydrolase [Rhodobacter sp. NTK016B]MBN8294319.1 alpha/beta fold hydrolase [Rhodobacter sp. NTK016B]
MEHNRVDATRPDSPPLSGPGPLPVGVRTITLTDPERLDLDALDGLPAGAPLPHTARRLCVELWYPASLGTEPGGHYETLLRDGETRAVLHGRAARDAVPATGRWPLVLLSHGYPGNRYLMAHLAEALASRGYLVAAADHPASTYDDQKPFGHTLYHRPMDQRFLLEALAQHDLADPDRAAIVGFSMGGYGALVTGGAGLVPAMAQHELAPPRGVLRAHVEGQLPPAPANLRALIAIGPWGNGHGLWSTRALSRLTLPLLVMAGSVDEISGYEAMRAIAELSGGTLLTFVNAGHNAAAPIPAPAESYAQSNRLGWAPFRHYADPVWDTVRMNALAQHFAAAFLDRHLKDDTTRDADLDPATALSEAQGFEPALSKGLKLERWQG